MKSQKMKSKNSRKDIIFKTLNDKKLLYLAIGLFLLMIPLGYNSWGLYREEIPGFESNYNLRIAQDIRDEQWNLYNFGERKIDNFTLNDKIQGVNLSTLLLSFFTENTAIIKIANVILMLILILLTYYFLKLNSVSLVERNIAIILMISSPVIIFYSLVISPILLYSILLILTGIAIKRKMKLGLILIGLLIPLFGVPHSIILIILALIYSVSTKETKISYYIITPIILSGIVIEYLGLNFSVFNINFYNIYDILNSIIAEFGAIAGIGIMTIVLSIIGYSVSFIERKYLIHQLTLIVIVTSIIFIDFRFTFLLNIALSIYGANGFSSLIKRKWYSDDLKKLTVLVIICGLLFTQLSYFSRIRDIEPTRETTEALKWLENLDKGIVLSNTELSSVIQNIAKMPTISNYFNQDIKIKMDLEQMFKSRSLENTRDLFFKYDIKYIYINDNMRRNIWLHNEDGLLFLFRDYDNFIKIYDDSGIKIFKFIGTEN